MSLHSDFNVLSATPCLVCNILCGRGKNGPQTSSLWSLADLDALGPGEFSSQVYRVKLNECNGTRADGVAAPLSKADYLELDQNQSLDHALCIWTDLGTNRFC